MVGNDGWEQVVTDLVTIHDYSASGDTMRVRYSTAAALDRTLTEIQPIYRSVLVRGSAREQQPVLITEFGGMTLGADAEHWKWYGAVPDAATFLAHYRSLIDALLDSTALAGFCYTQLTDTGQERNGMVTERREPKMDPAQIRAINQRLAAAVPADGIGAFEYGEPPVPPGLGPPSIEA